MRPWHRTWFWLLAGGCLFLVLNLVWFGTRSSYKGFPLPYVVSWRGQANHVEPWVHIYNTLAAIATACLQPMTPSLK